MLSQSVKDSILEANKPYVVIILLGIVYARDNRMIFLCGVHRYVHWRKTTNLESQADILLSIVSTPDVFRGVQPPAVGPKLGEEVVKQGALGCICKHTCSAYQSNLRLTMNNAD